MTDGHSFHFSAEYWLQVTPLWIICIQVTGTHDCLSSRQEMLIKCTQPSLVRMKT